jgi:hypothetical protein
MARIGRLAGAIIAHTGAQYFLVGNTKQPCDWMKAGFEPPVEIDAKKRPYLLLSVAGPVNLAGPWLLAEVEGEELAKRLAERLVIERTGSVSDRLWRLVTGLEDETPMTTETIDARWLAEVPMTVWQIVKDTVLRCT